MLQFIQGKIQSYLDNEYESNKTDWLKFVLDTLQETQRVKEITEEKLKEAIRDASNCDKWDELDELKDNAYDYWDKLDFFRNIITYLELSFWIWEVMTSSDSSETICYYCMWDDRIFVWDMETEFDSFEECIEFLTDCESQVNYFSI
jgi:hypothetical protein